MNILINGTEEKLVPGVTILDYLSTKKLHPDTVVVEHNQKIIESSGFQSAVLQGGDKLEILRFFGGG